MAFHYLNFQINGDECQTCHSTNLKKISSASKVVNAVMFALLKTNGRIVSYNSNTYGSSLENAANEREDREN